MCIITWTRFSPTCNIYYYGANGEKDPKSVVRDRSRV